MSEMTEHIPAVANDNLTPSSVNGKGELYDAVDQMDIAPEIQNQIDATEGFFLKVFGIEISLGKKFNPGDRVKILDMRRYPEEYTQEIKPMYESIGKKAA